MCTSYLKHLIKRGHQELPCYSSVERKTPNQRGSPGAHLSLSDKTHHSEKKNAGHGSQCSTGMNLKQSHTSAVTQAHRNVDSFEFHWFVLCS